MRVSSVPKSNELRASLRRYRAEVEGCSNSRGYVLKAGLEGRKRPCGLAPHIGPRRVSPSARPRVGRKLLPVLLIEELIERQIVVVGFRVHPALHPLRWIERALPGPDDNEPLSFLTAVTRLEQPVSPV